MIFFTAFFSLFVASAQAAPGCNPVTFKSQISLSPPENSKGMSPRFLNENEMIYPDSKNQLYIYNFKTKISKPATPPTKDRSSAVALSSDNQFAAMVSADQRHLTLMNLKTGKEERTISLSQPAAGVGISLSGEVEMYGKNGQPMPPLRIPDLQVTTRSTSEYMYRELENDPATGLRIVAGNARAQESFNTIVKVYRGNTLVHTYNGVGTGPAGYENGKVVIASTSSVNGDYSIKVYDLATGATSVKKTPMLSQFGNNVVFVKEPWQYDILTGKKVAPSNTEYVATADKKGGVYCRQNDGTAEYHDQQTNKSLFTMANSFCSDVAAVNRAQGVMLTRGGISSLISMKSVCIRPDIVIDSNPRSFCNVIAKKGIADALFEKTVCSVNYSDDMIKVLAINPNKKTYSIQETENYLKFLSKPNAFKLERDMNFINAVVHSDFSKQHPEVVQDAMAGILATDASVYKELTTPYKTGGRNFTMFTQAPAQKQNSSKACVSASEQKVIQDRIKQAYNLIDANNIDEQMQTLAPLQSSLQRFPGSEREQMRGKLSEAQTLSLQGTVPLGEVFGSKLHKFIDNGLGPLFGFDKQIMNDLVFVPDMIGNVNFTQPVVLSSGKIDRGEQTSYASIFSASALPAVPKKSGDLSIAWKSDQQPYVAKISMQKVNAQALKPKGAAPDYSAMWKDDKFTGAMVVGDNMRDHPLVMDQYQSYYERNGFKKTSETRITNFDQYLLGKIKSGELDYFVKEAHSDGDQQNLFLSAKTVIAKTFVKKVGDKEEIMTLYFPDPKDMANTQISNAAFGSAIKDRDKDGKGELIFLNTSCWSDKKAINEVFTAQTPKLVDVSVTTMASMFSGGDKRPIGTLLTGIRTGKSYQWLQDNVNKASANSDIDKYVVPNTKTYDETFAAAGPQVNTQIQVTAVK